MTNLSNKKFTYQDLDGLINVNTLGPFGKYFYKLQKPISINMSNFACRVAFYNIEGNLIYHRNNVLAHWLKPWNNIEIVKWSRQGNVVYFYEFESNKVYDSVFLHLEERYCIRINEIENKFSIVNGFNLRDRSFDEDFILSDIISQGFSKSNVFVENMKKENVLERLLSSNKWYP